MADLWRRCLALAKAGRGERGPACGTRAGGRCVGFSLIELLTVVTIVGLLAGMALGAAGSARERARMAQARTELAALAQALDAYKLQFGDYPQTAAFPRRGPQVTDANPIAVGDAEAKFFNALGGKLGPKMDASNTRPLVELAHFRCETAAMPDPSVPAPSEVANAFIDPWGRRYQYFYKNATAPATWVRPVYVLYSSGPDGADVPPEPTGSAAVSDPGNLNVDNLYAMEH